jgi:hypothetical protein
MSPIEETLRRPAREGTVGSGLSSCVGLGRKRRCQDLKKYNLFSSTTVSHPRAPHVPGNGRGCTYL